MISRSHQTEIVRRLIDSGQSFALYNMPGEKEPHLVLQQIPRDEEQHSGFLIMPYVETKMCPRVVIAPDVAVSGWELIDEYTTELPHLRATGYYFQNYKASSHENYTKAQRSFKYQIDRNRYQMLHLATSEIRQWQESEDLATLFLDKMEQNPNSFVYLLYTRITGRWIGICPTLLLSGNQFKWHTTALMGNNPYPTEIWDTKTKTAQHFFSDFIEGNLQQMGARIIRKGPFCFCSGESYHMATEFTFTLMRPQDAEDLLQSFYPSPATSGIPRIEAHNFIRLHEHHLRLYYGGYVGPLNLHCETACYLNTRCVHQMAGNRGLFFSGEPLLH